MSTDTDPSTRFICRYTGAATDTDYVFVVERPEMPELGEIISIALQRSRAWQAVDVAFRVTDLSASPSDEVFVMVECEIEMIGQEA